MKQPPGLQLLHCINSSSTGGKSFFCDSFAAADALYRDLEQGRRHFRTLSEYPVRYHYNQADKAFFDEKPVLEIEETPFSLRVSSPLMIRRNATGALCHSISLTDEI